MAYANGLIPDKKLVALSTTGRLLKGAAKSYERARIAAKLDGIDLRPAGSLDAFRPYATQEKIFRERYTTTVLSGRPAKMWNGCRWYQKSGTAMAAVPGTSNHGLGRTVDYTALGGFSGKGYKWLAAHPEYGWNNDEGRRISEPWHWTYVAADDKQRAKVGWYHVTAKTKGAKGARCYKTPALGKPKNVARVRPLGSNVKIVLVIGPWGLTKRGDWIRMAKLAKGKK